MMTVTTAAAILASAVFGATGGPFTLRTETEFQADAASALAYCGDACDELLIKKDFRYNLTDQKNISLFQLNIHEPAAGFLQCLEMDGRPPRELLFQSRLRDTVRLYIYRKQELVADLPLCAARDQNPPLGWDGAVTGAHCADLDADGSPDLLFTVAACFDLQPRGLIAYDLKDRRELWHVWLGAFPRDLHLTDADRDGKPEILLTTTAVCNGVDRGGFCDSLAYAACFRGDGSLLWRRTVGGRLIDAVSWCGDWDGDLEDELVVVPCEGMSGDTAVNRILVLDARTGATERYIGRGGEYMGAAVCDLDRDEKLELVTGNTDGVVRVYDRELRPARERRFDSRIDLLAAVDLNGDGALEVVLREPENRLVVLDEDLQTLCEYLTRTGQRLSAGFVRGPPQVKLLTYAGERPPFTYALLALAGPTFFDPRVETDRNIWFWSLLVLIAAFLPIHIIALRYLRKLKKRSEYAARLVEWSALAQRLAHEIKNPLSTINLTMQRIQEVSREKFGARAKALEKYTTSVFEEIERLRDTADVFMKILAQDQPRLLDENINDLLNEVLRHYALSMPAEIRIEKRLAPGLPFVRCDRSQMISMLGIVIENALEAMGDHGTLTVRSAALERPVKRRIERLVEIRIEDTGRGIGPEGLKRIFRSVYTTKDSGNGIGLLIARRVVESHRGRIEISSREGLGTSVTVQLPAGGQEA